MFGDGLCSGERRPQNSETARGRTNFFATTLLLHRHEHAHGCGQRRQFWRRRRQRRPRRRLRRRLRSVLRVRCAVGLVASRPCGCGVLGDGAARRRGSAARLGGAAWRLGGAAVLRGAARRLCVARCDAAARRRGCATVAWLGWAATARLGSSAAWWCGGEARRRWRRAAAWRCGSSAARVRGPVRGAVRQAGVAGQGVFQKQMSISYPKSLFSSSSLSCFLEPASKWHPKEDVR